MRYTPVQCSDAPYHPQRRRALGLFSALLLAPQFLRAQLADGLLSPQDIGKSAGAANALSPSSAADPLQNVNPLDGRYMAARTVDEIDSLVRRLLALVREIPNLENEIKDYRPKLQALIDERDAKMAEYRAGLFCSGCGQTKSEILAKRETFPHAGQSIVRPTQAQLSAKELQLQRPIDSMQGLVNGMENRLNDLERKRDEGKNQVMWGVQYWPTACSYQMQVLRLRQQRLENQHKTKRAEMVQLIEQIGQEAAQLQRTPAGDATAHKNKLADVAARAKLWSAKLTDLDRSYKTRREELDNALGAAQRSTDNDARQINTWLNQSDIVPLAIPHANFMLKSPFMSDTELGNMYRQGDADPANHSNTVAGVTGFIQRFHNLVDVALAAGVSMAGVSPLVAAPGGGATPGPATTVPPGSLLGAPLAPPTGSGTIPNNLLNLP